MTDLVVVDYYLFVHLLWSVNNVIDIIIYTPHAYTEKLSINSQLMNIFFLVQSNHYGIKKCFFDSQ